MSLISETTSASGCLVRDNCEICGGVRGGVLGNENRIEGLVVCDYCTVRLPRPPAGLISAATAATYSTALQEQLTFLTMSLQDPAAVVGTPDEIIGRMQKLLGDLGQLPPVILPPVPAGNEGRPMANAELSAATCMDLSRLTALDAAEVAVFAKALKGNACPYCAQPIAGAATSAEQLAPQSGDPSLIEIANKVTCHNTEPADFHAVLGALLHAQQIASKAVKS